MSLYEDAGGFDRILALCKAWHARLQQDPVAWHPFEHGTQYPVENVVFSVGPYRLCTVVFGSSVRTRRT